MNKINFRKEYKDINISDNNRDIYITPLKKFKIGSKKSKCWLKTKYNIFEKRDDLYFGWIWICIFHN